MNDKYDIVNVEETLAPALDAPPDDGALARTDQSRAMAEVQAAMAIAQRYPRNQVRALDRITQMCSRHTLAEKASYEYSRGGTSISGPSIRLAEAIAQAWGNIQFGIRELEQSRGVSTVEAYSWDLETNTRSSKVFQVPHVRSTRKGSYRLTDPRDIYELVANQGARRLRACILATIPGDVVETAERECEATLRTKVALTPERIKAMVEAFAAYGVTVEQLQTYLQRRIEAIQPSQFSRLQRVYNSIKDGMSASGDWFPSLPAETTNEVAKLKEDLKKAVVEHDKIEENSDTEM